MLERAPDAGVEDDDAHAGWKRDVLVGERACVQQKRVAAATQKRRGLIHDPRRHADGPVLCAPERLRQVHTVDLEVRDAAETECRHDLERRRRREPHTGRETGGEPARDPDLGPAELAKLRLDRRHIPLPAAVRVGRAERRPGRRLAVEGDPELDRDRQHETADEVGVLPH